VAISGLAPDSAPVLGEGRRRLGPLAVAALGIVFGDIGTSPLYALHECMTTGHGAQPTPANIMGVLSLIFWSLTMVVTVKYLTFILRADNHGEGGIFALLALIPERLRVTRVGRMGWASVLVIVGAALLYGDGMITPAISVLSAVEGLEIATPALKPLVVPLACVVLAGIFALQRRGTGAIGDLFGPVMLVWFVVLAFLGLRQLVANPSVLLAINPVFAVRFFAAQRAHAFVVLGSVVLVVTGGEALYADLGHFGRLPIRVAWFGLAMPALILNYFGQGALLLRDTHTRASPFFALVPLGPWTYALVALAAAATIIASQALISGVFSLTQQAVQLGFFPRVTITHTSRDTEGQIYVPEMNWGLATACIALVLVFERSNRLAAAYGLAVTGTMAITSLIFFEVTRAAWGWPLWRALPLLLSFLAFDLLFFGASLFKFADGGFVPVLIGAGFFVVMYTWHNGRRIYRDRLNVGATSLDHFLSEGDGRMAVRVPGTAVVLMRQSDGAPSVLLNLVQRIRAIPQTVVLLTVNVAHVPRFNTAQMQLGKLHDGFFRLVVEYGFMDVPDVPAALSSAIERFQLPIAVDEVTYYVGRDTFVATSAGRMGRWSEALFAFLSRNARSPTDHFRIPPQQVVEIGSRIDL
jgi:KUP system potassium uptake protein